MIALALLFVVIIRLLWLIIRLLQKYFDTYSNVYISQSNQNLKEQKCLEVQQNKVSFLKINQEINVVIDERLTEMEQKFSTEQLQEELTEILTENFKKALHSTLNLLKTEQYEA